MSQSWIYKTPSSGSSARSWRKRNGFTTDEFQNVPPVRLPDPYRDMTISQLRSELAFGDRTADPAFARGGVHGMQSFGIGGNHEGLRSYDKIPESAWKSLDGRYKVFPEGDDLYTIGLAIHYRRDIPREERFSSEHIPTLGQVIDVSGGKRLRYRLEITNIRIGLERERATCLVEGKLTTIDSK